VISIRSMLHNDEESLFEQIKYIHDNFPEIWIDKYINNLDCPFNYGFLDKCPSRELQHDCKKCWDLLLSGENKSSK